MKIIIKNNRNGSLGNEIVKKIVAYYLTELIGADKVDGVGTIKITFKKLIRRRGGYARWSGIDNHNYEIVVNSTWSDKELFKTFAHECTHVKQYFTGELFFTKKFGSRRVQTVTHWKGRQYIRKAYRLQPWELDAQKGEKLAYNILNKINAPAEVITKEPEPVKVLEVGIGATIANILKEGAILNADLVKRILNGDTDKQKTLKALRAVFNSKTDGFIREVIRDSIVWVELV